MTDTESFIEQKIHGHPNGRSVDVELLLAAGVGDDIFGKDMLKNEDHQAALEDPVYQTMSRLNLSPSHVEPQIDKVKLTDAQFYDYSKKAGGIYRSNVESIINIPGFANLPVKTQVELIYRQQAKSREQAKRYMVIRYPELAKRNAEINRGIVGMTDE